MVDQSWDTKRGELFINFIKPYFKDIKKIDVLDVGCRRGAFTFPLAKHCKKVTGIDIAGTIMEDTKKRAKGIKNITIKTQSILKTEFKDNSFDLITMEGVLEWVGIANRNKTPIGCQIQALKECKRLLKPNGVLYVGIENMLFPYFWLRDPHGKLPLTVLLHRHIANPFFRLVKGKGSYYGINILTYWGYKKVFNKVFNNSNILLPIPHYKYLYDVSTFDRKEVSKKLKKSSKIKKLAKIYKLSALSLKFASFLGMAKLFAPNFIIISRKK